MPEGHSWGAQVEQRLAAIEEHLHLGQADETDKADEAETQGDTTPASE